MSENLGLALGCLGFVALWRSAVQLNRGYGFLGLFLLTLALCARAGAFFVLPAIIIWGMWVFRGEKRFSGIFLLGGVGAVTAAFALNALLRLVISPGGFIGFSNFSYSLYGILAGGNWALVFTQHPEICQLQEPEITQRVTALAFDMLRQHPLWLLSGILQAWKTALWFPKPEQSIYGFFIILDSTVYPNPSIYDFLLSYILPVVNVLAFIALVAALKKKRDSRDLLMIAVAVGLFFSLPFARMVDADNMRAYAATIPFIALFPVSGLHWLLSKIWGKKKIVEDERSASWLPLTLLASILIALSAVVPMAIKAFARYYPVPPISSHNGLVACPIWFSPNASVSLTPENYSNFISGQNMVAAKDFKENMGLLGALYPDFARDFQSVNSSTTITYAPCLYESCGHLFIFDNSRIKIPAGPVRVYGEFINTNHCKILRVDKVKLLQ